MRATQVEACRGDQAALQLALKDVSDAVRAVGDRVGNELKTLRVDFNVMQAGMVESVAKIVEKGDLSACRAASALQSSMEAISTQVRL